MHTYRVWAPKGKRIEVTVNDQRTLMQPEQNGWFAAQGAEGDYGFFIDGEGPYPDPRSAWQPGGVHALSRWVDHSSFQWTDADWRPPPLSSAIVYELHAGTFTAEGTFDAAIEKLGHLRDLGVTHVELMPVNAFAGERGWGYDGVDLFAPHEPYGGPAGLKRLVDACHARGLAVLLDVVYNHLGPSGNYLGKFAPYFNEHYSTPWGPAINFDGADSGEVRRFFCDNALMWLRDYHFDGLRLDAVHAIVDTSAEPFLEQVGREVEALAARLGRSLALIPESDLNDPRLLYARHAGGFGLDAQWSDDFHHALHALLTGEQNGYYSDFGKIEHLAKALREAWVYAGDYSSHRRRKHGRPFHELSGHRFLGYLQNHDQVGNRAKGERSSQLMSVGKLKIGAALVFTAPFVPMIFQGEEWGTSTPFIFFTNHDEELGKAVREGRRKEFVAFGWKAEEIPDPQAVETFEKSKLNWNEVRQAGHAELLKWHRHLIQLRRAEASLTDGLLEDVHVNFDEKSGWLRMERGTITVICNFKSTTSEAPLNESSKIVLSSGGESVVRNKTIHLGPESVVILRRV